MVLITPEAELRALIKRRQEEGQFSAQLALPGPDAWAAFRELAATLRKEGFLVNGRDETHNVGDDVKPIFVTTTYVTVSWRR